jgi:hypothetical protein
MQFSVKLGYIVGVDDKTIQKQTPMEYMKQKIDWFSTHKVYIVTFRWYNIGQA